MENNIHFLLLILHCSMISLTMAATNIIIDQSAFLAIKSHTNHDPHNILATNWSISASVCSWRGVSSGKRHRRVIALDLSGMEFTGTVPPELGNLSFLAFPSLYNNSFHGSLPNELANLRRLKYLNLDWILHYTPELVFVCDDHLSVFIPSPTFNMPSLKIITFSTNNLSGPLPFELFDHLPELEEIYLSWNQLFGSIPCGLFSSQKFRILSLSNNSFEGTIPEEIRNLTTSQIGEVKSLEILSLIENSQAGSIPSKIGNLTQLKLLDLSYNNFTEDLSQVEHEQVDHDEGINEERVEQQQQSQVRAQVELSPLQEQDSLVP
ncbi:hypothetical protein EZV62_023495 [Acer yangbiense]|uniref:Leucine-rich repeat-containing N-terminal plant-type domain-containing protein n=1 Tax=Acer yangbiense TaxID=1000413 RepID=A0A5C7H285_9ROSI|nr:hypothetical protein EZV62_023495 [Acer yangbiense]